MKARHESKSFAKLTNELATPPTKLYSPFNIYTPSCSEDGNCNGSESATKTKDPSKAAKRNNRLTKKRAMVNKLALENSMNDSGLDCSMALTSPTSSTPNGPGEGAAAVDQPSMTVHGRTPKARIAWRHKRHLMQENAFASFASPTGRLRETVRDVEQFQQCIEDISVAIRARGGN